MNRALAAWGLLSAFTVSAKAFHLGMGVDQRPRVWTEAAADDRRALIAFLTTL